MLIEEAQGIRIISKILREDACGIRKTSNNIRNELKILRKEAQAIKNNSKMYYMSMNNNNILSREEQYVNIEKTYDDIKK